jgi:hypothetical protein
MAYYLIVDVNKADDWPQSFRIVDAPTLVDAIKGTQGNGEHRMAVIPLPAAEFDVDYTTPQPTIRQVKR